jgi:hypothetical protein
MFFLWCERQGFHTYIKQHTKLYFCIF